MFRFPSPVSCVGGSVGRSVGRAKKKKKMNTKESGFQRRPGCYVRKLGYKVNSKTWSFRLSNVSLTSESGIFVLCFFF